MGAMIEVIRVFGSFGMGSGFDKSFTFEFLPLRYDALLSNSIPTALLLPLLTLLATSLESTIADNDSTFIFSAILNPDNSASYPASLLVLSKLSLKSYVYFVLIGLMRTKPALHPLVLDVPSIEYFANFPEASTLFDWLIGDNFYGMSFEVPPQPY
uniref:Uncharacterized protein n=1 Tax=Tanacetum cinerariifolium TaxID=118510 RepID=A0A6L2MKG4_TANCI|nr:hypothetical protein [Tanacetum cinerariifolium]